MRESQSWRSSARGRRRDVVRGPRAGPGLPGQAPVVQPGHHEDVPTGAHQRRRQRREHLVQRYAGQLPRRAEVPRGLTRRGVGAQHERHGGGEPADGAPLLRRTTGARPAPAPAGRWDHHGRRRRRRRRRAWPRRSRRRRARRHGRAPSTAARVQQVHEHARLGTRSPGRDPEVEREGRQPVIEITQRRVPGGQPRVLRGRPRRPAGAGRHEATGGRSGCPAPRAHRHVSRRRGRAGPRRPPRPRWRRRAGGPGPGRRSSGPGATPPRAAAPARPAGRSRRRAGHAPGPGSRRSSWCSSTTRRTQVSDAGW